MATLSWITVVVMVIVVLIHIPTTKGRKPKPPKPLTIIRNCDELPKKSKSGIYTIYPYRGSPGYGVKVYCDMDTDGGGWTLIQRREDTLPPNERQDFYLTWQQYVLGFGDLSEQFWLGLDIIHALTDQTYNTIRFDLGDWDGITKWAQYDFFYVHDGSHNYKLEVEGYDPSSPAGDSFSMLNGMNFSTKDKNNIECAEIHRGAWWYKDELDYCGLSNLNGIYYDGSDNLIPNPTGIYWASWHGFWYSLRHTEMKIRPAY